MGNTIIVSQRQTKATLEEVRGTHTGEKNHRGKDTEFLRNLQDVPSEEVLKVEKCP